MKNQNYKILTFAITLVFLALIAVQFFWTHESMMLAHKQFEKNVRKSLHTLNRKLEKQEAAFYYTNQFGNQFGRHKGFRWKNRLDSLKTNIRNNLHEAMMDSFCIPSHRNDSVSYKQIIKIQSDGNDQEVMIEFNVSDSGSLHTNVEQSIEQRSRQLEYIFLEMMNNGNSFEERFDLSNFESLIKDALKQNGITTAFNYQLQANTFFGKKVVSQSKNSVDEKHAYFAPILPGLVGRNNREILISFPNKGIFLAKKIWLILITTILLISLLMYAFYYSIRSLIKQKKIGELKNDFISNMTHELKTPITSINLACETINDDNFDFNKASVSNYLKIISDENKRLKTLVNNVLDSSFINSDQQRIATAPVNIVSLIEEVKNRFNIILTNANGKITIPENNGIIINADKFHLSNAIFNLIDNAIKYTNKEPLIEISITKKNSSIVIAIQDNGIGIGKEYKARIFEKFYRVGKGNIHNVKGFGLGLNYVKRMIDLHGGSINLESELNKGSTFKIELPI